jgi:large subunit ribosomal protein L9
MKVILRSDVGGLGKRGDVVEVADGYARNYLVPKGLAMKASQGAVDQAAAMRRSRDVRDAAERGAAEEIARQLVPKVIHLEARSGAGGRLFGSITSSDIAEAVLAQTGIELDRRKLALEEPIRELGTHRAMAKLHADVEFPVTVEVAASGS